MSFSFFDTKPDPQGKTTPSMANVMKDAISGVAQNISVSCPAQVIKYYKDEQKVDVKPCFKNKYKDNKVQDQGIIYNVPVAFQRSGSSIISMPIKKDDYVMLVFQDKSMEKWLSNGGVVEPQDTRTHSKSDAVAYPGLFPFNKKKKVANDSDIIITNDSDGNKLEIRIKPSGKLQILNKNNDLIALIDEMLKTLREAVIYTSTGAQRLRHANFGRLHNKIKTFVAK